jgi:hypothetical protein
MADSRESDAHPSDSALFEKKKLSRSQELLRHSEVTSSARKSDEPKEVIRVTRYQGEISLLASSSPSHSPPSHGDSQGTPTRRPPKHLVDNSPTPTSTAAPTPTTTGEVKGKRSNSLGSHMYRESILSPGREKGEVREKEKEKEKESSLDAPKSVKLDVSSCRAMAASKQSLALLFNVRPFFFELI